MKPTIEIVIGRTHPNGRAYVQQIVERAARERRVYRHAPDRQPMSAAAMNASACIQWLWRKAPDIAQADGAASAAAGALKRAIDIS